MKLTKQETKNIYWRMQEPKEIKPSRFPIPGELAHNWNRRIMTLGELYKINPQIYVGYRMSGNELDGDSGHLTYELWKRTKDSRARTMAEAFEVLKSDPGLYYHPQLVEDIQRIDTDLALLSVLGKNGRETQPLILLNLYEGILPYSTGSTLDGTRRMMALMLALKNGELGDHNSVDVITCDLDSLVATGYNAVAFAMDNKPFGERVELLNERIEGNIDYSATL